MDNENRLEQAVRKRAQELFEQRGRVPGHELEDWLQAEGEIKASMTTVAARPAYLSVKVAGVTYIAEYDAENCHGYHPGEFHAGDPVQVRREQEKLFLTRPNGTELETRIVAPA